MRSPTGESLPYSLGWFAQRYAGHELRWHSGWWDDAYSALYLKVPDENLTLILLANSEGVWSDNPRSSAQVQKSSFARAFFRAFLERRPGMVLHLFKSGTPAPAPLIPLRRYA
jgi:hypothetical protein